MDKRKKNQIREGGSLVGGHHLHLNRQFNKFSIVPANSRASPPHRARPSTVGSEDSLFLLNAVSPDGRMTFPIPPHSNIAPHLTIIIAFAGRRNLAVNLVRGHDLERKAGRDIGN
jgi:hypothetical protein